MIKINNKITLELKKILLKKQKRLYTYIFDVLLLLFIEGKNIIG